MGSVLYKTAPNSDEATGGVPTPLHFWPIGYEFGGSHGTLRFNISLEQLDGAQENTVLMITILL